MKINAEILRKDLENVRKGETFNIPIAPVTKEFLESGYKRALVDNPEQPLSFEEFIGTFIERAFILTKAVYKLIEE